MQTDKLQKEIRELLPYSTISDDRKERVMKQMASLSGHDLLKILMVLQNEREGMMNILRKKERLDLEVEFLREKFGQGKSA